MKLRRPLPLTAAMVAEMRRSFTLEEVGALVILAMAWWPEGELPRSTYRAMQVLDAKRGTARRMLALLRPVFRADGTLGFLRAAHIVKAARRVKAGRAATRARMAKLGRDGSGPGDGT